MSKKPAKIIESSEEYGKDNSLKAFLHIIYGMFALSILAGGLPVVIGVIIAYFKRGESVDTIYESHYDYVIQTFWRLIMVFIVSCLAVAFIFIISTFLIFPLMFAWILMPLVLLAITLWFLYRSIRGWLCLFDDRAIPSDYMR